MKYCTSCELIIEDDQVETRTEADVGWSEEVCAACGDHRIEDIDEDWSLEQIRRARKWFKSMADYKANEMVSRLDAALELLEKSDE